jgi:hypothetical protein
VCQGPQNVKVKIYRNRPEGPKRGRGIALLFLDLGTRRGWWTTSRPGRFAPGKEPEPIVQEVGWAIKSFWTCAKNLATTGIRSLNVHSVVSRYTD